MIVVFLSDIAWDSLHQRPQHLAERLARASRVLWIEPVTLGRRMILTPVEEVHGIFRMMLPSFPLLARKPWIRRFARFASRARLLRHAENIVQRLLVKRGIRHLQLSKEETVCLVENFMFAHLAHSLHACRMVFDYIDDAFGFADFPAHVRNEWLATVRTADEVTVTSPTLQRRITAACPRSVHLIRNGVDYERFANPRDGNRPTDLPPAGTPIIGYIGSVYPWLDFDLLDRTVGAMADLQFVMIGHLHPEVHHDLHRLQRHGNFSFLGLKPYAAIPAYLAHFHAGIIPFRKNLLTEAVNPVKLYEYSAAGVPTIATDFSDDNVAFADFLLIAHSEEEFARHIRTAIVRRSDKEFSGKLRAFAEQNDWNSRAQEFTALLRHTT